jgi:endoglucanase
MSFYKTNPAMMKMSIVIACALSFSSPAYSQDSTAVEIHGQLRIQGNKMVDKNGNPVMLRGMCLYWSQWKGQFYNFDCVSWLNYDWQCNVIRASMGVEGGYLTNPAAEKLKIKTVIDACIALGIYVIVDWHDHNAQTHLSQSIAFFEEIAHEYGEVPNLIYEIFNEPLQVPWATSIKPYADSVVSHIRAIDPDNIIVVGTPTWSQNVDDAANNPLAYNNIAYALHFYATTHKDLIRTRASIALSKGAALFVTEFGTCEASGTGVMDSLETLRWLNFLEQNKISWCNWSIADLAETSAALNPGASATGGWAPITLKRSGAFIRSKIIEGNSSIPTNVESHASVPVGYVLNQNYPNPFNPNTSISFQLPSEGKVKLTVFDLLGREKARLVDGVRPAGVYKVLWNASTVPSGVYFYKLQAGTYVDVKKLMVLK